MTRTRAIGGEFEFFAEDYLTRVKRQTYEWPAGPRCVWTDTGRSALFIAASIIRTRGGQPRVWIPAYACGSISQAFLQAGFTVHYYSDTVGRWNSRESVAPAPERGDTLLFVHYFGHRNDAMLQTARECRAAGVWVIEDGVQGSLMAGLGSVGHFACTSYRKVLPVVDGAVLMGDEPIDLAAAGLALSEPSESFVSARLTGKLLRAAEAPADSFLPLFETSERQLEGLIVPRRMSWMSAWMLPRLDIDRASADRRANWLSMAQAFRDAELVQCASPWFSSLGECDVPLGFPVRVAAGRRDALRRHLASVDIFCAVHWPLDYFGDDHAFDEEHELAASALTLPIDQRMSRVDVQRVVDATRDFAHHTTPTQAVL